MTRRRVGVLISGRGSNLAALIAAARAPDYPAEIALVVSNRADAAGLAHASDRGVPVKVVDHTAFPGNAEFETELHAELSSAAVELVCLAGFMRVLSAAFVERWSGRILNIHPSLLPAFAGLETHRRVLAAGLRLHGATVHFVVAEVDSGPIVAQAAVPVLPDDDAERLAARVLRAEHRLYPMALKLVASGAARLAGERVVFDNRIAADPEAALFSPRDT